METLVAELCSTCGEPIDKARTSTKRTKKCRACQNAYAREWRAKNPEKHRGYAAAWGKRNPEKKRAIGRAAYKRNPEMYINSKMKSNFGITLQGYNDLLAAQGGGCAICGVKENVERVRGSIRFHIDHCHETGRIRGLLCLNCNMGIGKFKDDPERLIQAAIYLERV